MHWVFTKVFTQNKFFTSWVFVHRKHHKMKILCQLVERRKGKRWRRSTGPNSSLGTTGRRRRRRRSRRDMCSRWSGTRDERALLLLLLLLQSPARSVQHHRASRTVRPFAMHRAIAATAGALPWTLLLPALLLLLQVRPARPEVLTPPYFNLAEGRRITATATCGVGTQGPELYCKLVGANSERNVDYEGNLVIQGQVGARRVVQKSRSFIFCFKSSKTIPKQRSRS